VRCKHVRLLLESINIRGSIHAQIKSSSTLSLLLDFIFVATKVAGIFQSAFSNCILCTM